MTRGLLSALAVLLLLAAPLTMAATKKATQTAKRKAAVAKKVPRSIEEDAWSTPKPGAKKPAPKKTGKTASTLKPTVSWSDTAQPKVGTAEPAKTASGSGTETKPGEKTEPKPTETATATTSKSAEEQEKAANALLSKDPRGALTQYRTFLSNNPDYKYLGDVYVNAYAAAEKSNAPILDKIEMAGKAAMYLKQGRTRGPVDQRLIQKYENLTDKWINAWIEEEIRKAMSGR